MPVMVGVAGESDVIFVLQPDQPSHRVGRGRVHANAAVPVQGHESESRIDLLAHHREVDPVAFGNPRPIVHAGAAQRIHPHANAGAADRIEIDHVAEVGGVGLEKIVCPGGARALRLFEGQAFHIRQAGQQQRVSLFFDPGGDARVGRTAVRRIVFEAAILGRIVRGRDDDAVGQPVLAPEIVDEDRLGNRRRRGVFATLRYHRLDPVCRQDFQGALEGGPRQRMAIAADEQGSGDMLAPAIQANRLGDCQHMGLVEGAVERRAAMSGCAERHTLRRRRGIGAPRVVGVDQLGGIDELCRRRQVPCPRIDPWAGVRG